MPKQTHQRKPLHLDPTRPGKKEEMRCGEEARAPPGDDVVDCSQELLLSFYGLHDEIV